MISHQGRLWGAILLIAGTTLGGAILALPVTTGLAGLLPSLGVMTLVWGVMLLSGFYFLEVNLHIRGESNLVTMAGKTLGPFAKYLAGALYLLLLYSLTSAYLIGSGQLLEDFLEGWLPTMWESRELSMGCIVVFFALFLAIGTEAVDLLNRLMMFGLGTAFFVIIFLGGSSVELSHFTYVNLDYLFPTISTILTTFGFHVIIPSLSSYLEHDEKLLKRALIWGTVIPFAVYVIWELLVLGIVPVEGTNSLASLILRGTQVTFALKALLQSPMIGIFLRLFAFFAITTSLVGVTLSLEDFLADGLKISKKGFSRIILLSITFLPPYIFTIYYPSGFLKTLDYAGILVMLLLVILPILMAAAERVRLEKDSSFIKHRFKVWGGFPLMGALLMLSIILLILEFAK